MSVILTKAPTGQELYDLAVELDRVPVLVMLMGVLKTPNPAATLQWLHDVETDQRTRRGLAAALAELRAQGRG